MIEDHESAAAKDLRHGGQGVVERCQSTRLTVHSHSAPHLQAIAGRKRGGGCGFAGKGREAAAGFGNHLLLRDMQRVRAHPRAPTMEDGRGVAEGAVPEAEACVCIAPVRAARRVRGAAKDIEAQAQARQCQLLITSHVRYLSLVTSGTYH